MSKKYTRIVKVLGYSKHNDIEYLYVQWVDKSETWERMDRIKVKDLFLQFIERVERDISLRKTKKREAEESEINKFLYEKLIQARIEDGVCNVNALQKEKQTLAAPHGGIKNKDYNNPLNSGKTAAQPFREQNIKEEFINNSVQTKERGLTEDIRYKRQRTTTTSHKDDARTRKATYANVADEKAKKTAEPKFDKGGTFSIQNTKNFYSKPTAKRDPTNFSPKPSTNCSFNSSEQTTNNSNFEIRRAPAQRYFDHVIPVGAPKLIQSKTTNTVKFKLKDSVIGSFSYPVEIESGNVYKLNAFHADKIVNNNYVNALLFNLFMNVSMQRLLTLYRVEMLESIAMLDDYFNKMKCNNFTPIDTSDSHFAYMFLLDSSIIKRFGYDFSFIVIKMSKTLLNNSSDDIKISDAILSKNFTWTSDTIQKNALIENHIIFMLDEVELQKYGIFAILSDENNPISNDVFTLLKTNLFAKDENSLSIDSYFIHSDYIQFIDTIPNIPEYLASHTRFFVFNIFCLYEIFPQNGIYTIALTLLTDINKVAALNTLKAYDRWKCYVKASSLEEFKVFVNSYKNDLRYNELKRLYDWLSTVSYQFIGSDLDFITHLKSKNIKNFRHFYIVDLQSSKKMCKTPADLEILMKEPSLIKKT